MAVGICLVELFGQIERGDNFEYKIKGPCKNIKLMTRRHGKRMIAAQAFKVLFDLI